MFVKEAFLLHILPEFSILLRNIIMDEFISKLIKTLNETYPAEVLLLSWHQNIRIYSTKNDEERWWFGNARNWYGFYLINQEN